MKQALIEQDTRRLAMVGCFRNVPVGYEAVTVADDFNLTPWSVKLNENDVTWEAYDEPLTNDQIDRESAQSMPAITALKSMSPQQARDWVATNVNSLADAKSLLQTMAAVLCILARRL